MRCVCRREYDDDFKYCPYCGQPKVPKKKKSHRAINGCGYVFKRGITWSIRVQTGYRSLTKGGFRTKSEAQEYAKELKTKLEESIKAELEEKVTKPEYKSATMAEIYEKMMLRDEKGHRIGKSTINCYKAAYKYYKDIYDIPFADLNTEDWQMCIEDCPQGIQTKKNMKALGTKMYKYANELRVFGTATQTDFATFAYIDHQEQESRNPFTREDIAKLVKNKDKPDVMIVLAMCLTGFRPSEFLALTHDSYDPEHRTLRGGAKTEAGKNRIVPVHPMILPFIEDMYYSGAEYLFGTSSDTQYKIKTFREKVFYPALAVCKIQPVPEKFDKPRLTPYSTRHTFSTLMKDVDGAPKDKASLMGHTSYKMTMHYQHEDYKSLSDIIQAITV